MTIAVSNSEIIKSARRITTNPSVVSVKALKFNRKRDYSKFIKWIDSSTKELEKIKLPKKKDIKGISVKGGGIGLLGLLALGGASIVGASVLKKILDGTEFEMPEAPGLGMLKTGVFTGAALGTGVTVARKTNWFQRLFGGSKKTKVTMGKGTEEILKKSNWFNRFNKRLFKRGIGGGIATAGIDMATGTPTDEAVVGGVGYEVGSRLTAAGIGAGLGFLIPDGPLLVAGEVIGGLVGGLLGEEIMKGIYSKVKGESKDKSKYKSKDTPKVESGLSFSNTLNKFDNVVDDFCKGCSLINSDTYRLKSNGTKQSLRDMDIGFSDKKTGEDKFELKMNKGGGLNQWWDFMDVFPNPDVYDVVPKENKVSNIDFNKNQVIVMVPEGMQPPSGGGIVPIPIPIPTGGGGNIIMDNSSDDVNIIASNLLLTKLAV
tara:strand:- start:1295 stop:2584 length:1290 start_codon:yes stop_codon:yes gene_type:complete